MFWSMAPLVVVCIVLAGVLGMCSFAPNGPGEGAPPPYDVRLVTLDDGPVKPSSVKLVSTAGDKSLVKITLHEGRNHIVRRTMEAVGHPVRRLSRTGIGPVRLGTLKLGEFRDLTRDELGGLLDLVND